MTGKATEKLVATFLSARNPAALVDRRLQHRRNATNRPGTMGRRRSAWSPRPPGTFVSAAADSSLGRGFDVVISGIALIVLLPLLALIVIAIKLCSRGPAIFVQQRVGRGGKLFPCVKFRSMVVDAEERLEHLLATSESARAEWSRDQKLRKDPRITTIGALLRKSSFDELPQLVNVFLGQMSIVGPRPIVESEIVRYGHRFDAYCAVRPGLTGLWQISGRNNVSYDARVRLDARYAYRKSISYDLFICVKTISVVARSRGCY